MKRLGCDGQMTVEFAALFPAVLMAAFVALQGMVFAGDCAAFDAVARDAIRQQADDGYEGSAGASEVCAHIEESLGFQHVQVSVACEKTELGHARYTAKMEYRPRFLVDASIFGVRAPALSHEVSLTVSPYRKGVVI